MIRATSILFIDCRLSCALGSVEYIDFSTDRRSGTARMQAPGKTISVLTLMVLLAACDQSSTGDQGSGGSPERPVVGFADGVVAFLVHQRHVRSNIHGDL